ncbi:hypothetical protein HJG60_009383 [Phyllostomus discolor]|uniref:Uncharacterized protein n=1 Tax=Phyllostomus discolor TaxID=89673 RepID=A0A833Y8X3_9CHIR|nr:hypothetical protein HJG60_009383 [Phyllostomus discolor]
MPSLCQRPHASVSLSGATASHLPWARVPLAFTSTPECPGNRLLFRQLSSVKPKNLVLNETPGVFREADQGPGRPRGVPGPGLLSLPGARPGAGDPELTRTGSLPSESSHPIPFPRGFSPSAPPRTQFPTCPLEAKRV